VIRTALASAVVVSMLGNAPMQCSRSPDPDNRREDTAGDALWDLAEDFRAKGNEEARKQTLRFLVEKYPSNRHVPAAREELGIAK
jgi:TolA-binding protein